MRTGGEKWLWGEVGLRNGDEESVSAAPVAQRKRCAARSKSNTKSDVKGDGQECPSHTFLACPTLSYRVAKKLLATTAPSTPTINLNAMRSAL